jgi:hypothetical protein
MYGGKSDARLETVRDVVSGLIARTPRVRSERVSMSTAQRRVYDLFVLNVALQLFDAVATYEGLRLGVQEANPILARAFAHFGVAPALLLFKALACGLLFLLYRNHQHRVVAPALGFLAGVYCVLSLVPWLIKFGGILANAL